MHNLLDLTAPAWAEMDDACLLLPIGSVEQHGPHLPMGTDIRIAAAICEAACARSASVVAVPPIPFGASHHHKSIVGGAISVPPRALVDYIVSVVGDIVAGGRSVVVVNGHGGNWASITCALDELGSTVGEVPAVACSWWHLVPDLVSERNDAPGANIGHASAIETSFMLAQARRTVASDAIPAGGGPVPGADEREAVAPAFFYKWRDFGRSSREGVFGRPQEADEKFGRLLVETAAERLVRVAEVVRSGAPR
jgi:creatinine amidohydrolase